MRQESHSGLSLFLGEAPQIGSSRGVAYKVVTDPRSMPRSEWSFAVATELQRAVGEVLGVSRDGFQKEIKGLAYRLPAPRDSGERVDLCRRLLEFSLRVGRTFHDYYPHVRGCQFVPAETLVTWNDPVTDPRKALENWLTAYTTLFDRHHRQSLARKAESLLGRDPRQPLNLTSLARQVGSSRSALLRSFTRELGMSPLEYHARARLVIGVSALRDAVKVADAGRRAGYQSVKNFNHALQKYAGLTPSQVRQLPSSRFERLRDALLPAPNGVGGQQRQADARPVSSSPLRTRC